MTTHLFFYVFLNENLLCAIQKRNSILLVSKVTIIKGAKHNLKILKGFKDTVTCRVFLLYYVF